MASPAPLLYDTYYHIYNRGTNRTDIFIEDKNYAYFLQLYARHIEPVADTFAFCLLKNHFHLLAHIKSEEEIRDTFNDLDTLQSAFPSKKFSDFFTAYAKSINKAYDRTGSLFQHPFGRVPVQTTQQFWSVIRYIHQNPQKHGFVDDFRKWKYSSYASILSEKPTLLKRAEVLEWFGGRSQYLTLHQEWVSEGESAWFAKEDES